MLHAVDASIASARTNIEARDFPAAMADAARAGLLAEAAIVTRLGGEPSAYTDPDSAMAELFQWMKGSAEAEAAAGNLRELLRMQNNNETFYRLTGKPAPADLQPADAQDMVRLAVMLKSTARRVVNKGLG
jgi:hypothetical protein